MVAGGICLCEFISALSYTLDLTEGEPPGHAARSCLIGMRIADVLGLAAPARSDLCYALLLKDAGCSANAAHMVALFGADDHDAKRTSKRIDWARRLPALLWSARTTRSAGEQTQAGSGPAQELLGVLTANGVWTRLAPPARPHLPPAISGRAGSASHAQPLVKFPANSSAGPY